MQDKSRRGDPAISARVISELTPKKIMKEAGVTKGSVSQWKKLGFPIYFEKYLRCEYPKLNAWNLAENEREA